MKVFTPREEIIEVVNKLFVYTDGRLWEKLLREVFADQVLLDMSSLNGPNEKLTARAICDMWEEGFKDLDSVNHLGGNYLVTIKDENSASVFAYATATHYKEKAENGKTREFVGTYDLDLIRNENGWRISAFTYTLKYLTGNIGLE